MKSTIHTTMQKRTASILKISCFTLLMLLSFSSFAQDTNESPYFLVSPKDGETADFTLQSTDVHAVISGVIADVVVKQSYTNLGSTPLEAVYVFPASTRSAVYFMEMVIGERTITARIEEKDKARKQYDVAKKQGKKASLLEEERPNIFKMNVANIDPGETVEVTLRYTETLIPADKEYSFVYPTVVGARYKSVKESLDGKKSIPTSKNVSTPFEFDISVEVNASLPIQSIECVSHTTKTSQPTKSTAKITLSESTNEKDFIVRYSLAGAQIETGILTYTDPNGENYFMAMIQPPANVTSGDIPPREYIFIMDVSGSMNGFPLTISKQVLKGILSNLNENDLFNIIYFAGSARMFARQSQPATPENISKAIEYSNGNTGYGGTELLCALKAAFGLERETAYARTFAIFTDGYVSVEKETFDYMREHLGDANFFSFGIGESVNRLLIEGMAHVGCAEPFFAINHNEAKIQAEKFTKYISQPVLTNITYSFNGMDVYDVLPGKVPDVFADRPIILSGKYHNSMKGKLQISGVSGNEHIQQEVAIKSDGEENPALSYLWAREKIRLLGDYTTVGKTNELKKQITELGLQYNLLTEYTSFIAIEDNEVPEDYMMNDEPPLAMSLEEEMIPITRQSQVTPPPPPTGALNIIADEEAETTEIELIDIGCDDEEELDEDAIFMVVEKMPEFPGGTNSLKAYLKQNIVYPPEALAQNIAGRVYVSFVVDATGKITDIQVIRSIHPLLDAEAIRVVQSMPDWVPGTQRGKPVNVKYMLPINFGTSRPNYNNNYEEDYPIKVPPC